MSMEPRSLTAEQLLEHSAFLMRLARQLVGDEHRAEDLVQCAYALALERPPREARSLRGWLAVVVSNLARNEHRGAGRRQVRERLRAREERLEPGELALERLEVQRGLIEHVVTLSEELRTVLYLRYYENLTPSAIAQRLDLPVKTIKARHTRALAELRARLDAHSGGDRRAWMSALLPVAVQRNSAGPRNWLTRARVELALGITAALVAVVAWTGTRRNDTGSGEAGSGEEKAAALLAPDPAPRGGPSGGASLASAKPPVAALREPTLATASLREEVPQAFEAATLVLEVDRSRVRELGWAREGASDEQVVEAAAGVVDRRGQTLGLALHLRVEAERGRIEIVEPSHDPRKHELLEGWLGDLGLCEFLFVADEASLVGLDIDLAAERQKLDRWRAEHPELPLAAFHLLDAAGEGPHPRLTWSHWKHDDSLGGPEVPLLLPTRLEDHLGASSFARVIPEEDPFGYPRLWFEVSASRWSDLARITEAHAGQRLGAVIGDQLRSSPVLDSKWTGGGPIEGRFRDEELVLLAESFRKREGPLRVAGIR